MPGRKKRMKKGIESLRKQIGIHTEKLEEAKRSGNIGLTKYYEKEIESLWLAIGRRETLLKKKK
jgi:hypothetical protein